MAYYDNIARLARKATDTILPPRCPVTGEIVERPGLVSPRAWGALRFVSSPQCSCCGIPFEVVADDGQESPGDLLCGSCIAEPKPYARARSSLVYDDHSRPLILAFKHGDQTHLTVTFSTWLQQAAESLLPGIDAIVPVPLHWVRLIRRRYNQAALLGHALAAETGIPCWPDVLLRTRNTPTQGHLSAAERQENVSRAFSVRPERRDRLKDKTILLVDDVYTTGATLSECTRALLAAGVQRVEVVTLARVVRPGATG